jgi:hypothetical protein
MGRTACTEPQCLYKGALFTNIIDGDVQIKGVAVLSTQNDFITQLIVLH